MIIERLKNETYPLGRDRKELRADFIGGTPAWLTMPEGATIVNNGFQTNGTHTIETAAFSVSGMSQVGFGVNNWRLNSASATPSIKLVSTDGTREIGLYAASGITYFRYIVNGTTIYEDDQVRVGSNGIRKSVLIDSQVAISQNCPYAIRPKNLSIVFQPEMGHFHIILNESVIYSNTGLKTINTTGVDWSGTWKFVVESNGQMNGSSIEMMMEQDI